jgi:hypothetical protein
LTNKDIELFRRRSRTALGHEFLARGVARVRWDDQRFGAERPSRLIEPVLAGAGDRHARAFGEKALRRREPDAACAAGDERRFACKSPHDRLLFEDRGDRPRSRELLWPMVSSRISRPTPNPAFVEAEQSPRSVGLQADVVRRQGLRRRRPSAA